MAFTDDDEEVLPDVVSDYYFYDAEDQPISFAELPVQWSNAFSELCRECSDFAGDISVEKGDFDVIGGDSAITEAEVIKIVEDIMKPSFIVDDSSFECDGELTTKGAEDSESDDVDDTFDTVCAICDNGGDLTCCEGRCLRSFHATVKSAKFANSSCKSLGLLEEEVKGSQPFLCLNCSHEQHQCFVCGKLGSSNNLMVQRFFAVVLQHVAIFITFIVLQSCLKMKMTLKKKSLVANRSHVPHTNAINVKRKRMRR